MEYGTAMKSQWIVVDMDHDRIWIEDLRWMTGDGSQEMYHRR